MSTVQVRRVLSGDAHEDQKWLVLEGSIAGLPQVTKRVTMNTAALASGDVSLTAAKAKLIADVEEYEARWNVIQQVEL